MMSAQVEIDVSAEKKRSPALNSATGVNVRGYLRSESGVGSAARSYVKAIQSIDVPVAMHDLSHLCVNRSQDDSLRISDASCPYDINLICVDIEQHYAALEQIGDRSFDSGYNIGVWWWELMQFPAKWFDRFAYYDEIWVGTSFIANALAPISPVPVVRIPPVLALERTGTRDAGRQRLGVTDAEFVYLFIFDFNSIYNRKNPCAVVHAFRKAFHPSERARLVIKCVNERANPKAFADLKMCANEHAIDVHTGYWTSSEMRNLVAACDAYVSLHRAEGAGLGIADSMAHGKPVIATGWSGNMDFMNVCNSFPVKYDLVELTENAGPYRIGDIWAEPSIEHAAELMRYVFLNRKAAEICGLRAKKTIESECSTSRIGQMIGQRLKAIETRRQFTEFRRRTKETYSQYRGLVRHVCRETLRLAPPGATVAVVSKGDGEFLKLPNRTVWHFPMSLNGGYAGYYPSNSQAAILQLHDLCKRGAQYLVFPSTSFWWFEHYREFQQYLLENHEVVFQDEHLIVIALQGCRDGQDVSLGNPGEASLPGTGGSFFINES